VDELTDLDDIDDDINMDIDEPITSKLPDRNFNIRTLSNDMLNEMRNDE
jgi:hypothetical protein